MNKTRGVIREMLGKGERFLTEDVLVLAVYLVDWKHALENGKTLTGVEWRYAGVPVSHQVWREIISGGDLQRYPQHASFQRRVILVEDTKGETIGFTEEEMKTIRHVRDCLNRSSRSEFLRIVSSTYPILFHETCCSTDLLDLPLLAEEQRNTT